jgi:rubrerythrin
MTNEQAINLLDNLLGMVEDNHNSDYDKALKMGVEALEKQIPKKPDIEGDGYADGHLVYDTWICPNCEERYEIDYDYYDYCPKCGQAIDNSFRDCEVDWSEEE